jgi:hypothetical protein
MAADWQDACDYGIAPTNSEFVMRTIIGYISQFGLNEVLKFAKREGINEEWVLDAEKWALLM